MAQTVQHYLPQLLERGEIDPILRDNPSRYPRRRTGALQDFPRKEGRLHRGDHEAVANNQAVVMHPTMK
jgi:hypothetical protein